MVFHFWYLIMILLFSYRILLYTQLQYAIIIFRFQNIRFSITGILNIMKLLYSYLMFSVFHLMYSVMNRERATQAFSGFKRMTDFVQMFMILKLSFVQLLFCPSLYVLVPVCSCKCCCFLTYLTICCIILAKLLAISV